MRKLTGLSYALIVLTGAIPAGATAPAGADRIAVVNSVHPKVRNLAPSEVVAGGTYLGDMVLVLRMSQDARTKADQLLVDQQDPASPRYHQWLTPDQFGAQFGLSDADLGTVTSWLQSHGFTLSSVARNRLAITFSGSAAQVQSAFGTTLMKYQVNGETHTANATDVTLPRAVASLVGGVLSLSDFRSRPECRRLSSPSRPLITNGSYHYLSPGDWATIYNLQPLYAQGLTGAGVSIGVVGRTDIEAGDATWFLSNLGLPQTTVREPDVIHNGSDPGVQDPNDEFEADLDTQWSMGLAPQASVKFVVSPSSVITDGVDLSAQYLVDTNLAPIISVSYGQGEYEMSSSSLTFYNQLWMQASSQGISVFVAAGDCGAAGNDNPSDFTAEWGTAVNGLGSTPYNTCLGGTMFQDSGGTYWAAQGSNLWATTALGYIPETVWNEAGTDFDGAGLWAGGGGASTIYAQPSWQTGHGVPANGWRDVPDVSFSAAAGTDPYLVIQGYQRQVGLQDYSWVLMAGGTSAATPSMAAIMALVVQKYGRQGNAAPNLYKLAASNYAGIFHDVTTGNNSVPGVTGFTATAGYDQASGWGSLNANALVANWGGAQASPIIVTAGDPVSTLAGVQVMLGATASGGTGAPLTYAWAFGDGTTGTGSTVLHTYAAPASTTQPSYLASVTATDGTTTSQTQYVAVNVTPINVALAAITQPALGTDVMPGSTLTFSGTTLGQWPGGASGLTYAWDFGDGTTGTGATTTHAYTSSSLSGNQYTVTLTISDGMGHSAMANTTVVVDYGLMIQAYNPNPTKGYFDLDARDLLQLAAYWGTPGTVNGVARALAEAGDLNGDGKVDDSDITLWIDNYAKVVQ